LHVKADELSREIELAQGQLAPVKKEAESAVEKKQSSEEKE
jgi:hypothetical protein